MIFAAHQPNLLPWAPFWIKMDKAHSFALLTRAQYSKGAYHNRVRIGVAPQGPLLTIPVSMSLGQAIDQVLIAETVRTEKLLRLLYSTYSRTPHWKEYSEPLMTIMAGCCAGRRLIDVTLPLIYWLAEQLEISTRIWTAESSHPDPSENLAAWTVQASCSVYLSGSGAAGYLRTAPFTARRLTIKYSTPSIKAGYQASILTALFELGQDWRDCIEDDP